MIIGPADGERKKGTDEEEHDMVRRELDRGPVRLCPAKVANGAPEEVFEL
jgi:hypothetical protein